MKTVPTWQGMTAKEIIDGRDGTTHGGYYATGGIVWMYRTPYNQQGYLNDMALGVCRAEDADCITIEDIDGPVARMDL